MGKQLVANVKGIPLTQVTEVVEDYLEENPPDSAESHLQEHISDPTPHPVYDQIAAGRWVTYLKNGMA